MTEITRLVFMSVKDKLEPKYGCFEVFGVDFLLTNDLSPIIMEITSNPSFSTEMEDSQQFIRTLLRDVITLVNDLHESHKTRASHKMLEKAFRCA